MSQCNPQQAAGMFLLMCDGMTSGERLIKLTGMIDMFCMVGFNQGLDQGLDKCQAVYREKHSGGCRMLSEGSACDCFLCQVDNMRIKK